MREYPCEIMRVVDGDTVDVRCDLGFDVYKIVRIRIADIDTPEVRGPEREAGLRVKLVVQGLLPVGAYTSARISGQGKYGRWVGDLVLTGEETLGSWLVQNGLAEQVDYS